MAIEGATIVSQHILDDSGLREGLLKNERLIRASAANMARAFRDPVSGRFISDAAQRRMELGRLEAGINRTAFAGTRATHSFTEMRHAGLALGSSLHLVTGETGFLVIEMARMTNHMVRLTAVSGGLSAALSGVWAILARNPIAVAITAIAAVGAVAYQMWSGVNKELKKATEETRKLAEAEQKRWEDLKSKAATSVESAAIKLAMQQQLTDISLFPSNKGPGSDTIDAERKLAVKERFRAQDLAQQPGMSLEQADAIARSERLEARSARVAEAVDARRKAESAAEAKRKDDILSDEKRKWEVLVALRKQWAEEDHATALKNFAEEDRARISGLLKQREAIQGLQVRAGLARGSQFLGDPSEKALAELDERSVNRRGLADKFGGEGFGIRTQDANAFRFGPGAAGSVIGQQTEQRKTNEILKRMEDADKKDAADTVRLLRRIAGESVGGLGGTEISALGIL